MHLLLRYAASSVSRVASSLALGLVLLVVLGSSLAAQSASGTRPSGTQPKIYQLSGLVIAKAAGEPVPFTLIRVGKTRRTTTANEDGFYSLPVLATDTLHFQSIGYLPSMLVIADYLKEYKGDKDSPYLYEVHYLHEDSIVLPRVTIFPYRTPEELRTAMLNLPMLDNSPDALARANLAPEVLASLAETLPVDGAERRAAAAQQYYMNYKYNSGLPTVGLFDPFAVARMVGYMKRKAKAEREKTYDYWPEERPK